MMVNAGYCIPFLEQFNAHGSSEEDRVSMLKELAEIPLNETAANNLENESFIGTLTKMLSCNSHSSKSASLKCIKKMLAFEGLRTRFLMNERTTIPALLSLLKDDTAEQQCTHDALELLLSVAQTSQNLELDNEPAVFHELFSRDNIQELLEKIKTFANPKNKILLLQLLLELFQKSDASGEWILFESNAMSPLFSALVADENSEVRMYALKVLYRIARQHSTDIPLPTFPTKESIVSSFVAILTDGNRKIEAISAAAGIIGHLPTGDQSIDEILQTSNVLKALEDLMSYENRSNELQENALGALLRCTKHSKLEFLIQVSKLLPTLVQLLSTGSPLAKKCTALILDNLAQSQASSSSSFQRLSLHRKAWMKRGAACSVHGSGCAQRLVCLVTAKAVQPLVDMVGIMDSGASEAAFSVLDTLFGTDCDSNATSAAILESRGAWQILDVLERGALPVRFRALDLLGKIYNHPSFPSDKLKRFEGVLFSLQNSSEAELKSKAKVLLIELVSKTS
ncbi:hypothetical protein HPP92_023040 [Vanilla planifolia]|nr:hypothetical protein HPP92_023040 [Vanilla planifolia]